MQFNKKSILIIFIFLIFLLFLNFNITLSQTQFNYQVDTTNYAYQTSISKTTIIFDAPNIFFNNVSFYDKHIFFNTFLLGKPQEKIFNLFGIGSVYNHTIIVKNIKPFDDKIGKIIIYSTQTKANIILFLPEKPNKILKNNTEITNWTSDYNQYLTYIANGQSAIYYNPSQNLFNITIFPSSTIVLSLIWSIAETTTTTIVEPSLIVTTTIVEPSLIAAYPWATAVMLIIPLVFGFFFMILEKKLFLLGLGLGFILLWLFFGFHFGWALLGMFLIFLWIIIFRKE
jgi:hypothetical protein